MKTDLREPGARSAVGAGLDPTTLAVIKGWLEQIADEMDTILARSAFSTVISEQLDRACGIYEVETGGTVVQGRTGLPVFVGTMQFAVGAVIQKVKGEPVAPGDVFIVNDPYVAGTHLHDIRLVKPFYYRGRLVAWLAATGHWMDVGSSSPGGWNPRATDIIQEGIRILPSKIYHGGELDRDLLNLILSNLRLARDARADFQAQVNALYVGEKRLTEVFDKYGPETVSAAIGELLERSEQHMRSYIQEIPDGVYRFADYLDDDGITPEPLRVALTLTVHGSDMTLDFSESSPPCRGPYNGTVPNVIASSYIAIKHLFPDVPLNSGCFAPLRFIIPETTFLGAQFPRPHGGYIDVNCRVMDVVLGALAQAVPERAIAAPYSTLPIFALAGVHPDTRQFFVAIFFIGGGYGGSRESDGLHNGALPIGITRMASVEIMEQRFPIRYRALALREDSGGAGWRAGGCAARVEVEFLGETGLASNLGDRLKFGPFGILGGQGGKPGRVALVQNGSLRPITKETGIQLARGDRIIMEYPGGGGYGDPLKREVELVVRDVRRGYIGRAAAAELYGVTVKEGGPDGALTGERRRAR